MRNGGSPRMWPTDPNAYPTADPTTDPTADEAKDNNAQLDLGAGALGVNRLTPVIERPVLADRGPPLAPTATTTPPVDPASPLAPTSAAPRVAAAAAPAAP
jgi:hypothetical protein